MISKWLSMSLYALLWISSTSAGAQVLIGSSNNDSQSNAQSHAWSVYENSQGEILLVHLPPRDADPDAQIAYEPAVPGEMQAFRSLSSMPDGIAAIDNRVFMVFGRSRIPGIGANEGKPGKWVRKVYSGRAVRSPVGTAWNLMPQGRLDSEPMITHEGELVDLCATSSRLWALLEAEGEYMLLRMGQDEWEPIALPELSSQGSAPAAWRLSSVGDDLIAINVADQSAASAYVYGDDGWTVEWATIELTDPSIQPSKLIASPRGVVVVDRAGSASRIRIWSSAGVFTIASDVELPEGTELVAMGSVNRLIGIHRRSETTEAVENAPEDAPDLIQVFEIDLADGSIVYEGGPVVSNPVSEAELRLLMLMMMLIMGGVLVVVILPNNAESMSIPDGFSLADPGRRLLATMSDVFLVAIAVGMVFKVSAIEIITLSVITRSDVSWLVLPVTLAIGIVSMTLMEWLLGATPGKFLVGLRLVRANPGAMDRVRLRSAIVRNVIKWLLPPVVALALLDPEMLHRGDRATKTLVVSRIDGYDGSDSSKDSDSEA